MQNFSGWPFGQPDRHILCGKLWPKYSRQQENVQPSDMKKFIVELSKLSLSAVAILVAFFLILAIFEEGNSVDAEPINQEMVQMWLNDLDVPDEDTFKARDLQEMCSSKNSAEKAWCIGYVLGFSEGHEISPRLFCPGGNLGTAHQTIQSFNNFMEDNPQHWEKSRSAVLGAALQQTFPCN